MCKNLCLTYIFWFIGGAFGLHHIYLRRYKHAFIWWCLPGGFLGLGAIRDLWRLPEYVREANNDPDFLRKISQKMQKPSKPTTSTARFLGQIIVSQLFAFLVTMSIPGIEDLGVDLWLLKLILSPIACSIGIWIVGNIGRHQGSIIYPLISSIIICIILECLGLHYNIIVSIIGTIIFNLKTKKWRKTIQRPPVWWKAYFMLFICCVFYSSLWISFIYFNLYVVTRNGDSIKFRDAVHNFVKSPAFTKFQDNLDRLWIHAKTNGFSSTWEELIDSLDPLGEAHALKVLGLSKQSSWEDVRSVYRNLTKIWHPDKVRGHLEKTDANERFLDIQKAYEVLSKMRHRRWKNFVS